RAGGFLDQRRQRQTIERLSGRQLGELRHDFATALRRLAQEFHVVGVWRFRLEHALDLAHNQRDGGERRAELVGGGGGKAVELRQMLLARQHQFGGGQRVGKLARLL